MSNVSVRPVPSPFLSMNVIASDLGGELRWFRCSIKTKKNLLLSSVAQWLQRDPLLIENMVLHCFQNAFSAEGQAHLDDYGVEGRS